MKGKKKKQENTDENSNKGKEQKLGMKARGGSREVRKTNRIKRY